MIPGRIGKIPPEFCVPISGLQPPDWRWLRAMYLTASDQRLSPRDDPLVDEAVRFQRRWPDPTDAEARVQMARQQPQWHAALALYESDDLSRDVIDARLLGGWTPEALAHSMGVPSPVISLYRDLFWDVPAPGEGRDWVLVQALGISTWATHDPTERQVWLTIAHGAPPHLLEVLIGDVRGTPDPDPERRHREADILRRMVRLNAHLWRADRTLAVCNDELEQIHDQIMALGIPAQLQIELRQSMAIARVWERLVVAGEPKETERGHMGRGTAEDVAPAAGQDGVEHTLPDTAASAIESPA